MPVSNPSSGRLVIWLITSSMFICISVGIGFLIAYVLLPSDPSRAWIPIVGMILACLPWGFWVLTCFYRVISRALGFRFLIGGGDPNLETPNKPTRPISPEHTTDLPITIEAGNKEKVETGANFRDDASIASHESELHLTSSAAS